MTLNKKLSYYIAGCVIIILTIATIIFEMSKEKSLTVKALLFPNFNIEQQNIERVKVLQDGKELVLQKNQNNWVLPREDNHPVRLPAIIDLFQWIENIRTISRKTDDPKQFEKIGLLNPDIKQDKPREGSGTRIMLFGDSQTPIMDFIIGEKFHSYKMRDKERFFIRSTYGSSYLVESKKVPNFEPFYYLANSTELPAIEKIASISLYRYGRNEYKFQSITKDGEESTSFFPTKIPQGKRLIYPNITTDFVKAVMSKLYPKGAVLVDYTADISDDRVEIITKKNKKITLNFQRMDNDIHYMLILTEGLDPSKKIYAYQIDKKDYDGILQPFSAFLTNDVTAQSSN